MRWGKLAVVGAIAAGNLVVFFATWRASFLSPLAVATLWLVDALVWLMDIAATIWILWTIVLLWRDRHRRRELVVDPGHVRGTWFVTGLAGSMFVLPAVLALAFAWLRPVREESMPVFGAVFLWPLTFLPLWLAVAIPTVFEELQRSRRHRRVRQE